MTRAWDVVGIGLNATDTLILVPVFPSYAGKTAFTRESLSPGGQVATAVVTCAKLGLRTKYIGTIGDDLRGSVQLESLAGTGVDTSSVITRTGCPNQTAYIVIDESTGERTVLWHRNECLRLDKTEIRVEDVLQARMLHIDGFDAGAAVYAAQLAQRAGIPVSLDVDTVYPGFASVLECTDYLLAGSNWPLKFTGESDPFSALERLNREFGFRVTAMTLGDFGALALFQGEWFYSPAFSVKCLDTTGAGDVFHGAFCWAILQGMPPPAALDFSNAAAALNCMAVGARGHIPLLAEVQNLLKAAQTGKVVRRIDESVAARVTPASSSAAR